MTPNDDSPPPPASDPANARDASDDAGAGDDGDSDDAPATAGAEGGEPRKRRRRRRRREPGAEAGAPGAEPVLKAEQAAPPQQQPRPDDKRDDNRPRRDYRARFGDHPAVESAPTEAAAAAAEAAPTSTTPTAATPTTDRPRERHRRERGGDRQRGEPRANEPRANEPRTNEPRTNEPQRTGEQRPSEPRGERNRPERRERSGDRPREQRNEKRGEQRTEQRTEQRADQRTEQRGDRKDRPQAERSDAPAPPAAATPTFERAPARLEQRAPAHVDDVDLDAPATPAVAWGKDDDGPPPEVTLAADLPADAPAADPDPTTFPLAELPSAALGDDIASVAGVRFVTGGRIQWCDAGDADYARGERVLVDVERGSRLAWVAVPPARKAVRERGLRRVIRRANEQDLRGEREGDTDRSHALRVAKDKAAALRLPMKVFRVELLGSGRGGRVNVYYTTDERLDLRDFIRDVSNTLGGSRIELRQLGVRDEAKAVGGIGSCGLTLCCTTWLPDFVPVSIKMAKDQGLVLSPTKVSGQCGRLKCCLVYEQAAYAELRKGLPKLGKRVIGARGEGRVVEVDVLRQRIRVSYGPGDTEVVGATDVKPLFPSGNNPPARGPGGRPSDAAPDDSDDAEHDTDDAAEPDKAGASHLELPEMSDLPDEDPSRDLGALPDEDPTALPDTDD